MIGSVAWQAAAALSVSLFVAATIAPRAFCESNEAVVRHRALPVATFSASVKDGFLVVEAELASAWHIYAMDNVERARARSGKESPDCELPTRFEVEGPIELTGPWRQSEPKDLSDPEIFWYTWGFEDRAVFAAPARVTGDGAITVTVNGQACNASSCAMIQDLTVTAAIDSEAGSFDPDALVRLRREPVE